MSWLKFEIPSEWAESVIFKAAILKAEKELPHDIFMARIDECRGVDKRSVGHWVSNAVRDKYLAAIMEGKINIGS